MWTPPCEIEMAARIWTSGYPSRGAAIRDAIHLLQFDGRQLPYRRGENDFRHAQGQWDKRVLQYVAGI